jgi:hypothetical protein
MGQRPSFGALRKSKVETEAPVETPPAPVKKVDGRVQSTIRLEPAMWADLNTLVVRRRIKDGKRETVHSLLIEAATRFLREEMDS